MDDPVQPARSPRNPQSWSHDWHPYEDYLNVHTRYMTALLAAGTVIRDRLSRLEVQDGGELIAVQLRGRVECTNQLVVFVDKWLDVRRQRRGQYETKGMSYSYHAWVRGTRRTLLRYDSAHGLDGLHCHRLLPSGEELVHSVKLDALPTLTGFIEEAVGLAREIRR